MKTVLITGIAGFAGSFLAEFLLKDSANQIFGTTLSLSDSLNLTKIKDKIKYFE